MFRLNIVAPEGTGAVFRRSRLQLCRSPFSYIIKRQEIMKLRLKVMMRNEHEGKNGSQVAPDTDFISTVGRRTCFEVNHQKL